MRLSSGEHIIALGKVYAEAYASHIRAGVAHAAALSMAKQAMIHFHSGLSE
jgi:hypothetical protein